MKRGRVSFFLAIVLVSLISISGVFALDDLMALQGNVQESGVDLALGNLTVYIFNTSSGLGAVYNSTTDFNGAVVSGKYDVLLGNGSNDLSLNFGQVYYLEVYVNDEQFSFNGSSRQPFQSSVGQVDGLYISAGQVNESHFVSNVNLSNATGILGSAVTKGSGTNFLGNIFDSIIDTLFNMINDVNTTGNLQNLLNSTGIYSTYNATYSGYASPWQKTATSLYNDTNSVLIGINTSTPGNTFNVRGDGNITGELYLGEVAVSEWLYNMTDGSYNATYASINSSGNILTVIGGIYNGTYDSTYNVSYAAKYGVDDVAQFNSLNLTNFLRIGNNIIYADGSGLNISGDTHFNNGWQSGGVSILNGNVYAQTLFAVNITSLGVNNLNVNGSLNPDVNFDNTFDLGSATYQWRYGYFGTDVVINGVSVKDLLYNQSDGSYNVTYAGAVNNDSYLSTYNATYASINSSGNILTVIGGIYNGTYDSTYNSTYSAQKSSPFQTTSTTIYNDTSGVNVGIGTTTPASKLTVSGGNINITGTTPQLIVEDTNGDDFVISTDASNTYLDGSNNIQFRRAGGNTVTIDTSGQVGIGTASPAKKLDVNGDINASDIYLDGGDIYFLGGTRRISDTVNSAYTNIRPQNSLLAIYDGATNEKLRVYNSSGTGAVELSGENVPTIRALNDKTLAINPNGGNVGIGTATPLYKLHIETGGASGTNTTALLLRTASSTAGTGTSFDFSSASSTATTGRIKNIVDGSSAERHLIFSTLTTGGALTDKIIIEGDGNVGIGTSVPNQKLTVVGNLNITNTTGSPTFLLNDAGYLSMGTTTGFGVLDLKKPADQSYSYFRVSEDSDSTPATKNVISLTMNLASGSNYMYFWNHFLGNVFTVSNTGALNASDDITLQDGRNDGGDVLARIYDSADDGVFDLYQNNIVVSRLSGVASADNYINNGGKLGIGTATPTQLLDVAGNVNVSNAGANISLGGGAIYWDNPNSRLVIKVS